MKNLEPKNPPPRLSTARWPALGLIAVFLGACGATPAGNPTSPSVPSPLVVLESGAEAAYDHAIAGKTAEVRQDAAQISDAWAGYRTKAANAGLSPAAINELDAAVAALHQLVDVGTNNAVVVAGAANRISGSMDELFALYTPIVPPDLVALDYLGREVALDGLRGDVGKASSDIDALAARWAIARPSVVGSDGIDEARRFDDALAAVRTAAAAGDAPAITARANHLLERVDGLEAVFGA